MSRAPAGPIRADRCLRWLAPISAWPGTVHAWPVWHLQPRLRGYVLAVIITGAAATVAAATLTTWRLSDAVFYLLLLGFGAVAVEAVRPVGEPGGIIKDAHGVWQLATAILLPPFYALTAAVPVFVLNEWRVRRSLAHRRVFTVAAIGLSYGAASLAFHATWHRHWSMFPLAGHSGMLSSSALVWFALALAAASLRWVLNNALVLAAVRLDDPTARVLDMLGGRDGLYNDVAEACVGALVAFAAAASPLLLLVALPCGALLQRSSRHSQLVQASRIDSKTGLLSAATWQREAAVEVTRAIRTRTPLAVAMVDIDHFKQVNDTHGHLVGDAVLAGVAAALTGGMREYDLAGRFGGEEFSLLMPHADADEALHIAERLREILGQIPIPGGSQAGEEPPHITVSIGVAALTKGVNDLTDLLATADTALYRAKRAGRNTVRLADHPPEVPSCAPPARPSAAPAKEKSEAPGHHPPAGAGSAV